MLELLRTFWHNTRYRWIEYRTRPTYVYVDVVSHLNTEGIR
jgi:hypothetical protein